MLVLFILQQILYAAKYTPCLLDYHGNGKIYIDRYSRYRYSQIWTVQMHEAQIAIITTNQSHMTLCRLS